MGGGREKAASVRAIKIISHRGKLDFGKSCCGTSGIRSLVFFSLRRFGDFLTVVRGAVIPAVRRGGGGE